MISFQAYMNLPELFSDYSQAMLRNAIINKVVTMRIFFLVDYDFSFMGEGGNKHGLIHLTIPFNGLIVLPLPP